MRILIFFMVFMATTLKSQEINVVDFYSFEDVENTIETVEKPLIVYITTDWCAICKMQKHEINNDKNLVETLNKDFIVIELNAETYTKDIEFLGKTYNFYPNGDRGLHELAYELLDGSNAYPGWVFLDKKGKVISKTLGLISTQDFHYAIKNFYN